MNNPPPFGFFGGAAVAGPPTGTVDQSSHNSLPPPVTAVAAAAHTTVVAPAGLVPAAGLKEAPPANAGNQQQQLPPPLVAGLTDTANLAAGPVATAAVAPKEDANLATKAATTKTTPTKKKRAPAKPSPSSVPQLKFNLQTKSKIKVNNFGGVYQPGKSYSFTEKVRIANTYMRLLQEKQEANDRLPPREQKKKITISKVTLARAANCSPSYALKVITEIKKTSTVSDNTERKPFRVRGYGSRTFTNEDEQVLLAVLYSQGENTSLKDYQRILESRTGTKASISTIHSYLQQQKKKQQK